MQRESQDLLNELNARLPELEWKMSSLGTYFSPHSLPKGLFRYEMEPSAASCIAEIKRDIAALSQQENERSAVYLAQKIRQKINVLVALCHINGRKCTTEEKVYFGIKSLSTRQQWISTLEADIQVLENQQQALGTILQQKKRSGESADTILQIHAELGALERRLTLAKETLQRAIS